MNMDRFKFRFYAVELKRYLNNIEIGGIMLNALMHFDVKAPDVLTREQCLHITAPNDECIIEQCTGKTDKNGKLIYKGDKATFTIFDCYGKATQHIGTVEWFDCEYVLVTSEKLAWNLAWVINQDGDVEIIGNVHESEAHNIGVEIANNAFNKAVSEVENKTPWSKSESEAKS